MCSYGSDPPAPHTAAAERCCPCAEGRLSPRLHAGSGTSKTSKQPPGPRTSPHFKDGKPKASNSFPSSQQGYKRGIAHSRVLESDATERSGASSLTQRNKAAASGPGKKPAPVQGPGTAHAGWGQRHG